MCNKCDPSPNPGPGAAVVVCAGEVCVEEDNSLTTLTEAGAAGDLQISNNVEQPAAKLTCTA
jgi:hypothetical protein